MPTTNRVAIYARVSTKDQNCHIQLTELRRYAALREWEVIEEYVDTGWSGKSLQRPAMKRLLADARQRKFDTVIVYKLDRWGRSVINLVTSIADLVSFGIRFLVTTQAIDTDESSPTGRLLMNILAAVAEFEREIINERIAAGLKNVRDTGKTKSGKPIGRPVIVADRQAIWDRRAAGATHTELQDEFGLSRGTIQRIIAMNADRSQDKVA